jgi:predicted nucleic acid-binding protein
VTPIILDASAALALLLPNQSAAASSAFFDDGDRWLFTAPYVFEWEVRNVLLGRRRRVWSTDLYARTLEVLSDLAVELMPPPDAAELEDLCLLAEATQLSLFDASYLAAAIMDDLALVARDAPLLDAAHAAGLQAIDLR